MPDGELAAMGIVQLARAGEFDTGKSAWIGLVPKQNSSGGEDKLGDLTTRRCYLRSVFTLDALAVVRHAKLNGTKHRPRSTA